MEFMRELLEAKKKPTGLKKAAKSVYHRDYVKTKKKPYRKYDAEDYAQHTEGVNHMGEREYQTHSGWKAACKKAYPGCTFRGDRDIGGAVLNGHDVGEWDGAVGSVYKKETLKETVSEKVHQAYRKWQQDCKKADPNCTFAGGVGSAQAVNWIDPGNKIVGDWDGSKGTVVSTKEKSVKEALDFPNEVGQSTRNTPTTQPAAASSEVLSNLQRSLAELSTLLTQYDRLKPAQQPQQSTEQRMPKTPAGRTLQFSSFLRQSDNNQLTEGPWDGEQNDSNVQTTAPEQHPTVDSLANTKQAATQKIKQIVGDLKQLGPNAMQQLQQLCGKHCGPQAKRVMTVVTNAAQKLGVQL